MKKILLVLLALAGAWWYFVSSRTLTEERVGTFYQDMERATLDREPKAICALLAEDFETSGTVEIGGRTEESTQDRAQTCEAYVKLYDMFEKLGDKMGGLLQLDSRYEIHSIRISPDKKTATVDISTALDVAGTIMNIRSRNTDTLIRRNGKVLLLRSEGKGSIRSGG
jgi:hypothetical protein